MVRDNMSEILQVYKRLREKDKLNLRGKVEHN